MSKKNRIFIQFLHRSGALVGMALLASSCASSNFKNSALSNQNPAPAHMAPQLIEGKDAATVDPTYMRTQADYHFAMAEALSLDGESEKAIEEFKLAMVYDPQSASIRLRLAAEYLKQGLVSEAVENAEQGVELDKEHTDLRIFLGGVYSSLRMYPQAEKQYMAVLEYEPNNPEVFVFKGALYAEQDDEETACKVFYKSGETAKQRKSLFSSLLFSKALS